MTMTLGETIRYNRRCHGLTQAQLAAMVPCATGCIGMIEIGQRHPSLTVIAAIADALDVQVGSLWRAGRV